MKKFAHRGWAAGEHENTLEAFQRSAEAGLHGIEFDVRYGLDGRSVVVSHDPAQDGSSLLLEHALEYLQTTNLELLIELKEHHDDLYASVVQSLRQYDLVGRASIFAFPEIASKFPWGKREDIKLGIIAPYPQDIRKNIERHAPDAVLLGWGNKKERSMFKVFWRIFSLSRIFAKYPAVRFIVGVAYTEMDTRFLSRQTGLHGFTADMPLP